MSDQGYTDSGDQQDDVLSVTPPAQRFIPRQRIGPIIYGAAPVTTGGDLLPAPNPVAATLRAARAQIADPARWTQGAYTRITGSRIPGPVELVQRGYCWCAVGALAYVGEYEEGHVDQAIRQLAAQISPDFADRYIAEDRVTRFNDEATHADVLALFDRAIAAAEQEAP